MQCSFFSLVCEYQCFCYLIVKLLKGEHMSHRYVCQSVCIFTYAHYCTQSLCWPASVIPPGLSSLLHFSPLSLLTYSSVPLILSFLLHWGKRRFVTHYLLLPNDGLSRWQGLSFNRDREDYPVVTLILTSLATRGRRGIQDEYKGRVRP